MANPVYPVLEEAAAEVLESTVHGGTGVKHQVAAADGDSTPSALANLMNLEDGLMTLLGAAIQGLVIDLKDGLKIGAFALRYSIGGTAYSFAGTATKSLTASVTTSVYLDTTALLKLSTTGWPSGDHVKLAVVTTDATDVTAVSDRRYENMQVGAVSNWWNFKPSAAIDLDDQVIEKMKSLRFTSPAPLTLDGAGQISPVQSLNTVDTFEGAATDDLERIMAFMDVGQALLILQAADPDHTVVVKDNAWHKMPDGDFALDDDEKAIVFVQADSVWIELSRGRNTLAVLTAALNAAGYAITDVGTFSLQTSELTIASGAVTKTGSCHTIDTESDAATDDLDTISGGSDKELLLISGNTPGSRVVTLKHNTGNVWLQWAADYVMDGAGKWILLRYNSALSKWEEITRSYISIADLAGTAEAIPYPLAPIYIEGALSGTDQKVNVYCPIAFTLKNATGIVNTAPSGGACIVDIKDDGASIFSSQGEMINITDGQTQSTSATKNHVFAAGSIMTFELEDINGAADLTITPNAYIAPQTPPT